MPVATLSGQPSGVVNYNTADIRVDGANVVAYEYKLDDGGWSVETLVGTHIILSGLSDGVHTVSVIGKNVAGTWQLQESATTASWMVNSTLALATLSGQPSGVVNYNAADITVGGEGIVAYKYKLDNGTWSAETPVSTHIILYSLGDGMHTVSVIGKNPLGNWQAEANATTASWTVDTTDPTVTLNNIPDFVKSLTLINGTSADTPLGQVDKVQVQIKNTTDSTYWDGTSWVATETWLDATGRTSWSYSTPSLIDGKSYEI